MYAILEQHNIDQVRTLLSYQFVAYIFRAYLHDNSHDIIFQPNWPLIDNMPIPSQMELHAKGYTIAYSSLEIHRKIAEAVLLQRQWTGETSHFSYLEVYIIRHFHQLIPVDYGNGCYYLEPIVDNGELAEIMITYIINIQKHNLTSFFRRFSSFR